MKKNVIMFFPLKNHTIDLTHPYQELRNAEEKQNTLLGSFPSEVWVFMARWEHSYCWGEEFSPQFQKIWNTWFPYTWTVHADLVLGFEIPAWVKNIFNSMHTLTRNKCNIEEIFPEITLKSKLCLNYQDIVHNFLNVSSRLKVLKPRDGTRSRWIFIGENLPDNEILETKNFPYILQDFFDTSAWFYEFPWLHDCRIILLDGKIIWKFLRQPEVGTYIANTFRNGGFIDLKDWEIPVELQKIIQTIESYCSKKYKHRYYSIDVWQWPNGELKIFELNSAPWLTNNFISSELWNYIVKNILKLT